MKQFLDRFFDLGKHHTTLRKELIAGITTFSTLAYALVVVPLIISEAGVDFSSAMAATILTGVAATLIMGLFANYPFAVAPGMGMTAYFTYSVVLGNGIHWQTALGVVFLTGIILLILWAARLRELIIHAIPNGLKIGTTAGIGLFLVMVALNNTHLIVSHPQTLVALGDVTTPEALLTAFGIVLIAALLSLRIQGAILIGILANWIIGLALGVVQWKGIMAWPHLPSETFLALDIKNAFHLDMAMVLFSFLFVCLFDTGGTIIGLGHQGRFLDKQKKLPHLWRVLLPDSIGTTLGSLLGASASAVYIESAAGIAAGGRTGLTAVVVSLLFICALFFEPLASSIPFFAVAPVLLIIGAMMLRAVVDLEWDDPSDYIPCFVTIVAIPLTYSIGIGIALGIVLYPLCKILAGKWREVHWLTWILAILMVLRFALIK